METPRRHAPTRYLLLLVQQGQHQQLQLAITIAGPPLQAGWGSNKVSSNGYAKPYS